MQPSLDVPFIDEQGKASRLRCPRWPSPWHLIGGVFRWSGIGWSDRIALGRVLRAAQAMRRDQTRGRVSAERERAAGETVDQWLARHGQPARLRTLFWEPLAVAALNQDVRVAGAASFVRVLDRNVRARPARRVARVSGRSPSIGCSPIRRRPTSKRAAAKCACTAWPG